MASGRDGDRERGWRKVLAEQAASGLSVRAFCKRAGVAESNFYAWRRELALRDREAEAEAEAGHRQGPAFVRAVVREKPQPEAASVSLELASGYVLRLPGNAAVEQLADLVVALQQRGAR